MHSGVEERQAGGICRLTVWSQHSGSSHPWYSENNQNTVLLERKEKKKKGERESYESTGVHLILTGVDERFQMVFQMQEVISMLCFKVSVEAGLGKTMENDIRSQ